MLSLLRGDQRELSIMNNWNLVKVLIAQQSWETVTFLNKAFNENSFLALGEEEDRCMPLLQKRRVVSSFGDGNFFHTLCILQASKISYIAPIGQRF